MLCHRRQTRDSPEKPVDFPEVVSGSRSGSRTVDVYRSFAAACRAEVCRNVVPILRP